MTNPYGYTQVLVTPKVLVKLALGLPQLRQQVLTIPVKNLDKAYLR